MEVCLKAITRSTTTSNMLCFVLFMLFDPVHSIDRDGNFLESLTFLVIHTRLSRLLLGKQNYFFPFAEFFAKCFVIFYCNSNVWYTCNTERFMKTSTTWQDIWEAEPSFRFNNNNSSMDIYIFIGNLTMKKYLERYKSIENIESTRSFSSCLGSNPLIVIIKILIYINLRAV